MAHSSVKVSDIKFSDLGLSPTLLATLEREGYVHPTPIQAQAIPHLLKGHDLQGIAQTGTGKTAAFALPILQHILSNRQMPAPKMVRTLILSPTRELASQIAEAFKTYSRGLGLSIATIYGGVKYGPQYKALTGGLDILVATPGRLIDHIEQKTVDLRGVEFFVLDEADQMLDLGFVKPIRQIASRLPHKRQNLFFSATMPKEIGALAAELLTDPKRVEVTPEATTAERVSQQVIFIEAQRKRALLSELYADAALDRTLIFTRTKRAADRVAAYLQAGGIEAAAIHGDKNQSQRERALQAFRDGRVRALVATDIAARGIDVDGVSHVINYELPNVPEAYVHRIGRTARAGKSGISITLCADDERKLLKDIQRVTRQTIPTFDRRKDQALKLLDEAILASGQTEKPKTPDRVQPAKSARHSDPDAEFVHKRSRKRPGQKDRARARADGAPGPRGERTEHVERYDPIAAERPADALANGRSSNGRPSNGRPSNGRPSNGKPFNARPFAERPSNGPSSGGKPFRKPDGFRDGARPEGKRPEGKRHEGARLEGARPESVRHDGDNRPRPAGQNTGKPGGKPFAQKPGGKKPFGKPNGKPGGFQSGKPAFFDRSDAPRDRSEGAQLKRRSRS
ncbi:MAG: DEAD/DEAH box helicase [Asticcacaulis sp.]